MNTFFCIYLTVAILVLGSHAYAPYKEFDPWDTPSPNTCASSNSAWVAAVKSSLSAFGLGDRLITNETELNHYAEDYGHIYHRVPKAAFVATCGEDIAVLIRIANIFKSTPNRFQVVVRGGSGNVQGATQVDCDSAASHQIILDLTLINSVQVSRKFAWVGAGSSWLNFVEKTAEHNLRPTVVPDYLGITVGGYVGIGGFGPDSAAVGPSLDQVLEIELVTPVGEVLTVGPNNQYFQAVRGGMGNFGIMTRLKMRLEKNDALTRVYHILTDNYDAFFQSMRDFVDNYIPHRVETIQAFAIPKSLDNLVSFVAPLSALNQVRPAVDQVLAANQTWVYYLELTVRGTPNFRSKSQIAGMLPSGMNPDLIFIQDQPTIEFDNRLKLTTIPFLVQIGAWQQRHPWGIFMISDSAVSTTWRNIQENLDPLLDMGFGLLAIYPYATDSVDTNSFLSVPRSDDHFFLITLGKTDVIGTPESLAYQGQGNRNIWDTLTAVDDAKIYPSVYIPDFGPADWAKNFGPAKWATIRATKKALDPNFVLGDTRNFGFASLY